MQRSHRTAPGLSQTAHLVGQSVSAAMRAAASTAAAINDLLFSLDAHMARRYRCDLANHTPQRRRARRRFLANLRRAANCHPTQEPLLSIQFRPLHKRGGRCISLGRGGRLAPYGRRVSCPCGCLSLAGALPLREAGALPLRVDRVPCPQEGGCLSLHGKALPS